MPGWNINLPTTEYLDLPVDAMRLQEVIREVSAQPFIAIDTETTGLVIWKDLPLYWSLAWPGKRMTLHAGLLHHFNDVFSNPNITWVFANAKYDMHILANVGVTISGKVVDVQVMHSLLYEDTSHRLKDIAKHILGWTWAGFEDQFGKIGARQSAEDVIRRAERENMSLLIEYAANDAWGTFSIFEVLRTQLEQALTHSLFRTTPPYIDTLWDLFWKIEVPYTKTLWRMERHGIKVDRARLEIAAPEAEKELLRIEQEVARIAGKVVNLKSPTQLRQLLIDERNLAPVKWTKGGKGGDRQPSVDAVFLEHYKNDPLVHLISTHREYSKLYNTYIVGLHELLDPNGRVHTRYNMDVARTGRLSSSEPNTQNIPRPENDKWNLRGAFIPEEGNVIIAADYEQLEMRLLAAAAMEPKMIKIFADGKDIHTGNAEMVFGIPYDDIVQAKKIDKLVKSGELPKTALTDYVSLCLRRRYEIKSLCFGLNYGMGANRLSNELNISQSEAVALMDKYMETYPAVKKFFMEAVQETRDKGYAFTILGRRRNVTEINSYRKDEKAQGERIATNTPIQGSAADVCKLAQINIDKVRLEERTGCKQLLQVHDEIVFECPAETAAQAAVEIQDLMEHPFYYDLPVHLAVEIGKGASWGSAK